MALRSTTRATRRCKQALLLQAHTSLHFLSMLCCCVVVLPAAVLYPNLFQAHAITHGYLY